MCGILAILGIQASSLQEIRDKAALLSRRLRHRGPDWSGSKFYQLPSGKWAVMCHERLGIVDPTSGEQPLYGCSDDICVCANGEIYNHRHLRQLLADHNLKTGSDCEVIGHLYEKHGIDFVNQLDGMFACVIYDHSQNRLIAFRDHVGICPLYIGFGTEGEIWISSEMKAIHDQCASFQVFLPGQLYDSNTRAFTQWYQPAWYDSSVIPTNQVDLNVLRETIEAAVIKRLMSDVPFGVLISGGLDSSIIAAMVMRHSQNRVEDDEHSAAWYPRIHSFAIGLVGSPDLQFAQEVADYLGTVHHSFNFTVEQGVDALREVIYHLETYNPTTIRASTPMYFMARKIKSMGFKMVLSGEGADEIFGGYLYFHKAPNPEEFHKETVDKVKDLYKYDLLRGNKSTMAFGLELRVPFLDKEVLNYAMALDPSCKMPQNNERKIEKYILRKAFEGYIPDNILWRQKEQFSDGVGYNWIDSLKSYASQTITDEMLQNAQYRFPVNTPANKEAYLYRQIFEELFPENSSIATVPGTPSVACSTARALEWDESFRNNADESGRAVLGVHTQYKNFNTESSAQFQAQHQLLINKYLNLQQMADEAYEYMGWENKVRWINYIIEKTKSSLNKDVYEPEDFGGYDVLNYGLHDIIYEFLDSLPTDRQITLLDIGSGFGAEPRRACKRKPNLRVIATEIMAGFVEVMRKMNEMCGMEDRIDARVLDAATEQLENLDQKVDAVFSSGVMLFIPDKDTLFRRMNKVCNQGAVVYIEDYLSHADFRPNAEEQAALDNLGFRGYISPAQYMLALENAGFHILKFRDSTVHVCRDIMNKSEIYLTDKEQYIAVGGQEFWDGWPNYTVTQCALTLMRSLQMSPQEAAEKYPKLFELRGMAEFERWIDLKPNLIYCSFIAVKVRDLEQQQAFIVVRN